MGHDFFQRVLTTPFASGRWRADANCGNGRGAVVRSRRFLSIRPDGELPARVAIFISGHWLIWKVVNGVQTSPLDPPVWPSPRMVNESREGQTHRFSGPMGRSKL